MSEFTPAHRESAHLRHHLLTSVSAGAMLAMVMASPARADDTARPTVWIELGGQLERISSPSQTFAPAFIGNNSDSPAFQPVSPLQSQHSPRYAKGFNGKLTFQPGGSDWIFTASILYGRANGNKEVHQQTPGIEVPASFPIHNFSILNPAPIKIFSNMAATHHESHAVLDFQVGRDVGVGLFGSAGTSTFDAGVRFAQFSSRTNVALLGRPDIVMKPPIGLKYWTTYAASLERSASFHGIGPTLSWNNSNDLMGDPDDGGLTFDWGVNAAVLFGRQKVEGSHTTATRYFAGALRGYTPGTSNGANTPRSRRVVVPNVGGFAGLSVRYSSAKFSFGYRGDFFFGAMDTGLDTRKTSDMSFHGPFATISIGLGG